MKILIATFVLLIAGLMELTDPVRTVFQSVTSPVQFGLRRTALELKEFGSFYTNINDIRKENLSLIKEAQELKGKIADLKNAEEENQILRRQLALRNDGKFDKSLLMALVMGNPSDTSGNSIMLDKGSKQAVQIGDNVIFGNSLVGIVTQVSQQRSVVELITSPNTSMTVKSLEKNSQAEGIATGSMGVGIAVTRLLPEDIVEPGDIFSTSGKDGRFEPELVVGEVSEVSFESAEPLRTALLKPYVVFDSLERVFIILRP